MYLHGSVGATRTNEINLTFEGLGPEMYPEIFSMNFITSLITWPYSSLMYCCLLRNIFKDVFV